jgi:ABC-2 type transport system permease protein
MYVLYLFLFIALSVWVSLISASGKNALLTLLGIWICMAILMPKTVSGLSESIYRLPSLREFKENIDNDITNGLDGNTPRTVRMAQLEKEYLQKYGADSVQQLPLNFEGVSMQAGEVYGNLVYDHHLTALRTIFHKQNRLASMASLLNPYMSVKHLSMGLSGTDIHTSIDFEQKAEAYRRALVEKMNNDMAINSKYGEFYEYSAGQELWKQIPDFSYHAPAAYAVINHYRLEVFSLLLWVGIVIVLLSYSNRKIKPTHG